MNTPEIERALEVVLVEAERAAEAVMSVYETAFAVDYKSEADPVTAADRVANAILCEALEKNFPGVPVVAEESEPATYAKWHESNATWFVDPLDGTRDFVERNGQFAVMIGLAVDGKALLGVVFAPAIGRRFVGAPGVGAFELAPDGSRREIRVSSTQSLADVEVVMSRSRPSARLEAVCDELGIVKRTRLGSAGLKGIKVACAEADAYAHLEQAGYLWDSCAPEAIVVAAGGTVTDALGNAIDYGSNILANENGMLMSNGRVHARMIEAIAKHRG